MDKKTEALKLALEALENLPEMCGIEEAITAVQEALAEQPELEEGCQCPACEVTPHASDCAVHNEPAYPKGSCDCGAQQQEPVAYAVYHRMGGSKSLHWPEQHSPDGDANQYQLVPLYTSPPASKPWVGLTDEQISDLWDGHTVPVFGKTGINPIVFARAIEAKLKEKNA